MIRLDGTVLCEHEHWAWSPGFAERQVGHHFRAAREVAVSQAPVPPAYRGSGAVLEPGSLLRLDAAIVAEDACSDAFFGRFRCRVLTGSLAGSCVEIPGQQTASVLRPSAFDRGARGPEGCVRVD